MFIKKDKIVFLKIMNTFIISFMERLFFMFWIYFNILFTFLFIFE